MVRLPQAFILLNLTKFKILNTFRVEIQIFKEHLNIFFLVTQPLQLFATS